MGCSSNDEIILASRDLLHDLPGIFTVVKCSNCGLMRTNPRPSPDTIGFYYPENYGPYVGTRVQPENPKSASLLKLGVDEYRFAGHCQYSRGACRSWG